MRTHAMLIATLWLALGCEERREEIQEGLGDAPRGDAISWLACSGESSAARFRLVHVEPTGIVGQMVTPFTLERRFRLAGPVDRVTIVDAAGAHDVPVE